MMSQRARATASAKSLRDWCDRRRVQSVVPEMSVASINQ